MLAIFLIPLVFSADVSTQSPCPPVDFAQSVATLSNPARAAGSPGAGAFSCREDATLTRMFTPPTVPQGTYRVYVTDAALETVLAQFRAVASSAGTEGAWVAKAMAPLDAYGNGSRYDRAKVARLYVGLRARVARGPIVAHGRTVASITLVSPYPDATLQRLQPGTLIMEFKVAQVGSR